MDFAWIARNPASVSAAHVRSSVRRRFDERVVKDALNEDPVRHAKRLTDARRYLLRWRGRRPAHAI
jgi:hypothetical protein